MQDFDYITDYKTINEETKESHIALDYSRNYI